MNDLHKKELYHRIFGAAELDGEVLSYISKSKESGRWFEETYTVGDYMITAVTECSTCIITSLTIKKVFDD